MEKPVSGEIESGAGLSVRRVTREVKVKIGDIIRSDPTRLSHRPNFLVSKERQVTTSPRRD